MITSESTSVMKLATITGIAPCAMPHASQSAVPLANTVNMPHEISCADRVCAIRNTCGMKEIVVNVPATTPSKS